MPSIRMRLEGADRLKRALEQAPAAAGQEIKRVLWNGGTEIFNQSQRIVPFDTGALSASGRMTMIRSDAMIPVDIEIRYGGPSVPYAWVQHEDLSLRHDPGRSAKFVEIPMMRAAPVINRQLGRVMGRTLAQLLSGGRARRFLTPAPLEATQGA